MYLSNWLTTDNYTDSLTFLLFWLDFTSPFEESVDTDPADHSLLMIQLIIINTVV
jgi:hypothetical protein